MSYPDEENDRIKEVLKRLQPISTMLENGEYIYKNPCRIFTIIYPLVVSEYDIPVPEIEPGKNSISVRWVKNDIRISIRIMVDGRYSFNASIGTAKELSLSIAKSDIRDIWKLKPYFEFMENEPS